MMCTFRWLSGQKTVFSWQIVKTYSENRFSFIKYSEKLIFRSRKTINVLKVFGKINFHYSGEVTHPTYKSLATAVH